MDNLKEFEDELDDFIEVINTEVLSVTKRLSKIIYNYIIAISPSPQLRVITGDAEWSMGSYVLSHRIGIDKVDSESPTIVKGGQGEGSAVQKAALRLKKLNTLKPYHDVFITNDIQWGPAVEFGWPTLFSWPGAKHGPYGIYRKATMKGRMELERMVKE